jgi:lipopolysaccharide transport system permease protein
MEQNGDIEMSESLRKSSNLSERIYSPEPAIRKPIVFLEDIIRDFRLSLDLGYSLFIKDIKAQYRVAFLGISWLLILPAVQILLWYILFQNKIISTGGAPADYLAYMSSGIVLWTIFSEAVNAPIINGTNSKSILVKLNFPREAIIISGLYQVLLNAAIRSVLLIVLLTAIGFFRLDWNLLLFPLSIISLIIAGTIVGMFFFPFAMLYSDINKALPIILQLGMFVSPVVYIPLEKGMLYKIIQANPLSIMIETGRNGAMGLGNASLSDFFATFLICLCFLVLLWFIYRITLPIIIERISS